MSYSFKNVLSSGSGSQQDPVADYASLPTSGNTDGDLRVTLDSHVLYVWNQGTATWDLVAGGGGGSITSVNGDVGPAVVLDTGDIAEGSNQYFTTARARTAAVADAIVDGVTNVAPSQNAVFDALALKADDSVVVKTVNGQSPVAGAVTVTTTNITEGTNLYYTDSRAKTAAVADAIVNGVVDVAPSQNAAFDALALKRDLSDDIDLTSEVTGLLPIANQVSQPHTTVIYVDKNRVDVYTADGSSTRPYLTIEAAVDAAILLSPTKCKLDIAPGQYVESNTFKLIENIYLNGVSRDLVRIQKSDASAVVIDFTANVSHRMGISNVTFTHGLLVDRTGDTTGGANVDLREVYIGGTFGYAGRGSGVDFLNVNNSAITGNVTISGMSGIINTSNLYGSVTMNTTGATVADAYGTYILVSMQATYVAGNITASAAASKPAAYQFFGTLGDGGWTFNGSSAAVDLYIDGSSGNFLGSTYSKVGTVNTYRYGHPSNIGYNPTTAANWNSVPNNLLSALDTLASSGSVKSQASNTILSAPSGGAGIPSFRVLDPSDVPSLDSSKITSGSVSRVAYFDSSNELAALDSVGVSDVYGAQALGIYNTATISDDVANYNKIFNIETEIDPSVASTNVSVATVQLDSHLDRTHSNENFGNQYINVAMTQSVEGDGINGDVFLLTGNQQLSGNGAGSVDQAYLTNIGSNISSTYEVTSFIAENLSLVIQSGGILGSSTFANYSVFGDITGNAQGINYNHVGNVGDSFTGSNVSLTGDVTNSATVSRIGMTGDADSVRGLDVFISGNFTSAAQGINVDMSNAIVPGGLPATAIAFNGHVQGGVDLTPPSGQTVLSGHTIATTLIVPSGTPVTGTDTIALNLACLLLAEDDVAYGPLSIGQSAVGYVGQLSVTSGSVVDGYNFSLAGASVPVASTGGTVTDVSMYRAVDVFTVGGTLDITNLYGLKIDSGFGSMADNIYGVHSAAPTAINFLGGKSIFGSAYSAPTVEVDIDGDLRIRNLTAIGVMLNDASGNVASLAPGTVGNILRSDGSNWQSVAAAVPILSAPVTLVDNTSSAATVLSYAATNDFAILEYSIERDTDRRAGRLILACDGTTVSMTDDFAEHGDVGVVLTATVSAGNVVVQYTTTSTGNNGSFKYFSKIWS